MWTYQSPVFPTKMSPRPLPLGRCLSCGRTHPGFAVSMQGFLFLVTVGMPQFPPVDPQLWHVTSEYTAVSLSSWLGQGPLCENERDSTVWGGCCIPRNILLRLECARAWANFGDSVTAPRCLSSLKAFWNFYSFTIIERFVLMNSMEPPRSWSHMAPWHHERQQ